MSFLQYRLKDTNLDTPRFPVFLGRNGRGTVLCLFKLYHLTTLLPCSNACSLDSPYPDFSAVLNNEAELHAHSRSTFDDINKRKQK
jgi:hypothetical protein